MLVQIHIINYYCAIKPYVSCAIYFDTESDQLQDALEREQYREHEIYVVHYLVEKGTFRAMLDTYNNNTANESFNQPRVFVLKTIRRLLDIRNRFARWLIWHIAYTLRFTKQRNSKILTQTV